VSGYLLHSPTVRSADYYRRHFHHGRRCRDDYDRLSVAQAHA